MRLTIILSRSLALVAAMPAADSNLVPPRLLSLRNPHQAHLDTSHALHRLETRSPRDEGLNGPATGEAHGSDVQDVSAVAVTDHKSKSKSKGKGGGGGDSDSDSDGGGGSLRGGHGSIYGSDPDSSSSKKHGYRNNHHVSKKEYEELNKQAEKQVANEPRDRRDLRIRAHHKKHCDSGGLQCFYGFKTRPAGYPEKKAHYYCYFHTCASCSCQPYVWTPDIIGPEGATGMTLYDFPRTSLDMYRRNCSTRKQNSCIETQVLANGTALDYERY